MNPSRIARRPLLGVSCLLMALGSCPLLSLPRVAFCPATLTVAPPDRIALLDAPFLFAYGTWQNRVKVEGGLARLRGEGVTPRGGAGCNVSLDLSEAADASPTLDVRIGALNRMGALRLMLRDADGHAATWEFTLPAAGSDFIRLTPVDGASLAHPGALEKPDQPLDLRHIIQWQLSGDWSSDLSIDLEVRQIGLVAPDADVLAQRKARARRDEEESARRIQAQEALRLKYRPGTPSSPGVESMSLVAPDILAITVQAGHVIPSSLSPYQPRPGDEKRPRDRQTILARDGQEIGWLIGPRQDHLVTFERLEGDPLLEALADQPQTYSLRSQDDPGFAGGVRPLAVYRKSKPTDWAQPSRGFAIRHILYLKSPHPFVPGKTYTVSLGDLNTRQPLCSFRCDPGTVRTEALHVQQIGFRPDDPIKRAFLSIWLGTGGAYHYAEGLKFSLVDAATDRSVYSGKAVIAKAADDPEAMWKRQNFNGTDVWRLDFSDFSTPGIYRVCVEGIGCSYPFSIARDVWQRAFQIQMQGLYNERSGVALGPPYTQFIKPRDFYPGDGVSVTQSSYSMLEKGGEAWADLARGDTGKPVPQAWGGYHDAGDWNPRRVTHMQVTHAQLELMELFPQTFRTLKLRIPPTPGLPDLLTEARFELDCFRRLQKPDGSVPYGIETNGDPTDGEVSWMQSMPAYVFAPDIWSSYYYAGVAVRFARLLEPFQPAQAAIYRASALKAALWAESRWPQRTALDPTFDKDHWQARDDRNFAALQIYLLTGDPHWHAVFLQDTCLKTERPNVAVWGDHVQRDAVFAYAHLSDHLADPALRRRARATVIGEADASLAYAAGNAFNIATPDPGKPMFLSFYSAPDAMELARAHYLTGQAGYLAGAVAACQFSAGCNPANMTYTTGLGANPPRHPLHLDSRRTGQPAPPGLTPYGNIDFSQWHDSFTTWPLTYYLNAICAPAPLDWPTTEAYFDIFLYPAMNEFTVDKWTPNVYVWGYLAARR